MEGMSELACRKNSNPTGVCKSPTTYTPSTLLRQRRDSRRLSSEFGSCFNGYGKSLPARCLTIDVCRPASEGGATSYFRSTAGRIVSCALYLIAGVFSGGLMFLLIGLAGSLGGPAPIRAHISYFGSLLLVVAAVTALFRFRGTGWIAPRGSSPAGCSTGRPCWRRRILLEYCCW